LVLEQLLDEYARRLAEDIQAFQWTPIPRMSCLVTKQKKQNMKWKNLENGKRNQEKCENAKFEKKLVETTDITKKSSASTSY